MNRLFVLFLLLVAGVNARAQQRPTADTLFFRPSSVPAHLKPIERGAGSLGALGSVYYYGGHRLRSSKSLEIPFYELNDPTVLRHLGKARFLTVLSGIVSVLPAVYSLSRGGNRNGYWTVLGGSLAGSLTLMVVSNGQISKAVSAYNRRLAGVPSLGLHLVPTVPGQLPTGSPVVSWQF